MAISYGIIERHQGKIDIETELGKGTTFVITLPVTVSEDAVEEEITAKIHGFKI